MRIGATSPMVGRFGQAQAEFIFKALFGVQTYARVASTTSPRKARNRCSSGEDGEPGDRKNAAFWGSSGRRFVEGCFRSAQPDQQRAPADFLKNRTSRDFIVSMKVLI